MKVTVSRAADQHWICAGSMFFAAQNEVGDPVTIDASLEAWDTVQRDWADDPIAKIEDMAEDPRAGWEPFGADRVWRVYL